MGIRISDEALDGWYENAKLDNAMTIFVPSDIRVLISNLRDARNQLKIAKAALEFYGDLKNWERTCSHTSTSINPPWPLDYEDRQSDHDLGFRAREALEQLK